MRRVLAAILVLSGVACAPLPPVAPVVVDKAPDSVSTAGEAPAMKNSTLKYLASRNLQPQPTRPLNVRSKCTQRDAAGTETQLDLRVEAAEVKVFDAAIRIKGQGLCRFRLADFEQVARLPQTLLRHRRQADCTVRLWEQGREVTVAFNSCRQSCEGEAFDYLWPVLVDAKTGRCH